MAARQEVSSTRPLLAGLSHGLAVVPAACGAIILIERAHDSPRKQLSLAVYGVILVLLFAVSALYHGRKWTPAQKARLRRLDQSNVFMMIAGTYTPIIASVFSGWITLVALAAIWSMALVGIVLVSLKARLHRLIPTSLYLVIGWTSLLMAPATIARLGWTGFSYVVTGGALYTLGAVTYALKRPRLWPRIFGFHEVFHILVIAASVVFYLLLFREVVPLPIR